MPDRRRSGSELDTTTSVRPLVIGNVFAVFMCTAVTLAAIVVPGNNAVLGKNVVLQGLVHAAEKALAVDGIDVGGPDQWPDDGQNPSYARQGSFVQCFSNNSRCFVRTTRAFGRDGLSIECQP